MNPNLLLTGAGLLFLALSKKGGAEGNAQAMAISADALASEAATDAQASGVSPGIVQDTKKTSYDTLLALFGVGAAGVVLVKKIAAKRVKGLAPFDSNNLPTPKQAAILKSVSPEAFQAAIPTKAQPVYEMIIARDSALAKLAAEKSSSVVVKNAVTLLPASMAQLHATMNAESVLGLFSSGNFKNTEMAKLANEVILATQQKVAGQMTEKQLSALVVPRLKKMNSIYLTFKGPAFVGKALAALESAVMKKTALNGATVVKALDYVKNIALLPRFNEKQVNAFFQKELDKELAKLKKGANALPSSAAETAAKKSEAEVAQKAEAAAAKRAEAAAARKAEEKAPRTAAKALESIFK